GLVGGFPGDALRLPLLLVQLAEEGGEGGLQGVDGLEHLARLLVRRRGEQWRIFGLHLGLRLVKGAVLLLASVVGGLGGLAQFLDQARHVVGLRLVLDGPAVRPCAGLRQQVVSRLRDQVIGRRVRQVDGLRGHAAAPNGLDSSSSRAVQRASIAASFSGSAVSSSAHSLLPSLRVFSSSAGEAAAFSLATKASARSARVAGGTAVGLDGGADCSSRSPWTYLLSS